MVQAEIRAWQRRVENDQPPLGITMTHSFYEHLGNASYVRGTVLMSRNRKSQPLQSFETHRENRQWNII